MASAEAENRVIITHDVGFRSIYYFSKKEKVGIIIIRVHPANCRGSKSSSDKVFVQSKLGKGKCNQKTLCYIERNTG